MSYAIIRVRNLHMEDLQGTCNHNDRKHKEVGKDLPNVDPTRTHGNMSYSDFRESNENLDLEEIVKEQLQDVKVRKNSVVALEYVCTLSPEVMEQLDETQSMASILSNLKDFLVNKHGMDNIAMVSYHYDESNPHVHVVVLPLKEKEVRWKNKRGEGVKIEKRLCARDYTGNKELLRELQTDYHNYVTNDSPYLKSALKRSEITLNRGVDARERRESGKYYSQMTNHIIANHLKEQRRLAEDLKNQLISLEKYREEEQRISKTINSITDNMEKKKQEDEKNYKNNNSWNMFR